MKAIEQYIRVVLFIKLCKVALTLESVDGILNCDHSVGLFILLYKVFLFPEYSSKEITVRFFFIRGVCAFAFGSFSFVSYPST